VSSFLFTCFISGLTEKQLLNAINVQWDIFERPVWKATNRATVCNTWVSDIIYLLLSFLIERFIAQRRYECDVCKRDYAWNKTLRNHINKQGGRCTMPPKVVAGLLAE